MRRLLIGLSVLVFTVLLLAIGYIYGKKSQTSAQLLPKAIRRSHYQYVNPLSDCEFYPDEGLVSTKNLKNQLQSVVDQAKTENQVDSISVYYRDLNQGAWTAINPDEKYIPASLFKMFVVFTYYRALEIDSNFNQLQIPYPTNTNNPAVTKLPNNNDEVGKSIQPGEVYHPKELVEKILLYSDNKANELLKETLAIKKSGLYLKVTDDFGFDPTGVDGEEEIINVVNYANFFRVLYNASYLNADHSNELLSISVKADFKEGLAAGLPNDIQLANKFGWRDKESGLVDQGQLHDCGIVYAPNKPYILCVMTKGENPNRQAKTIAEVSRITYQFVSNN